MHRHRLRSGVFLVVVAIGSAPAIAAGPSSSPAVPTESVQARSAADARFFGTVRDPQGEPIVGAMVTFQRGDPLHAVTGFTDEDGRYRVTAPPGPGPTLVRARRIGWKDQRVVDPEPSTQRPFDLRLEPETDPAAVAAQLPANRWYKLVLDRIPDDVEREELIRQCTYCHQQGSWATRRVRDTKEWNKLLALMARMGGILNPELRAKLPAIFNAAYDPATAIPALTERMHEPDFAPSPGPEVRRAIVDEWELGHRASMQHDLAVHPDGRIYSVDMLQDQLYRLDPSAPDGDRKAWNIPPGDLPLGGVLASLGTPMPPNSNAHVGPHSLQIAPDGAIWITLALGNQLARFDPDTEEWSIHALEQGFYPHTLRLDQRGRVWFTIAASNHLGMFDPATGEHREIRLPAASFKQAVVLRLMPYAIWLNDHFDLSGAAAAGEGMNLPVPYGVDIGPDGVVWFSQLNEHRIGRVDPDSFEIEMIDTPFSAPRRLRFDSKGKLWIPAFSDALIARFDPETREFEKWVMPIDPPGTETPYALNVDRREDIVWICGTNSDSLWRFDPATEQFTSFPLPTRVTYTREIDFDAEGRVWTSNSNVPTWQIEGGFPRILRLDPEGVGAWRVDIAEPDPRR